MQQVRAKKDTMFIAIEMNTLQNFATTKFQLFSYLIYKINTDWAKLEKYHLETILFSITTYNVMCLDSFILEFILQSLTQLFFYPFTPKI